jgi:biotin transport system substrate-specific component
MSEPRTAVAGEGLVSTSVSWAPQALASLACVGALAASAHVRIPLPFTPVPITLQTLIVAVAAVTLGPRWAAASIALYLGLGAAGLPVMTAPLIGPTTGYLVGFFVAALVTGSLARPSHPTWRIALAMAAGAIVIYVCGAGWLAGIEGQLCRGTLCRYVMPFVLGDALKLVAAVAIVKAGRACGMPLRR